MWVTKLLISPVKKKIFCPKTTKFGPKLAFLVDLGQTMQAFSVPCWWVSWWLSRAGCISQDTYLLYIGKAKIKSCPKLKLYTSNNKSLLLYSLPDIFSTFMCLPIFLNSGSWRHLAKQYPRQSLKCSEVHCY